MATRPLNGPKFASWRYHHGAVSKASTTRLLIPAVKSAIDHHPFFPSLS